MTVSGAESKSEMVKIGMHNAVKQQRFLNTLPAEGDTEKKGMIYWASLKKCIVCKEENHIGLMLWLTSLVHHFCKNEKKFWQSRK